VTLIAAWVRQVSKIQQLVVISDSRVGGGERWDWAPKVLVLPRPATVGAVAGDMTIAYAYLLQAVSMTSLETGLGSGRVDIGNFVRQMERVLIPSRVSGVLSDLPTPNLDTHTAELFLGGWSWRRSRFEGYRLSYEGRGRIQKHDVFQGREGIDTVHFFGSESKAARERLLQKVQNLAGAPIRWEPLEVLIEMCEDRMVDDVGGPPQIIVANQHGLCDQFLIPWPINGPNSELHFGGRPLGRQRTDLRAVRFARDGEGRFDIEPYFPADLSIRSSEIERAREAFAEERTPSAPEFDTAGPVADALSSEGDE
jgi:hypothetical protein